LQAPPFSLLHNCNLVHQISTSVRNKKNHRFFISYRPIRCQLPPLHHQDRPAQACDRDGTVGEGDQPTTNSTIPTRINMQKDNLPISLRGVTENTKNSTWDMTIFNATRILFLPTFPLPMKLTSGRPHRGIVKPGTAAPNLHPVQPRTVVSGPGLADIRQLMCTKKNMKLGLHNRDSGVTRISLSFLNGEFDLLACLPSLWMNFYHLTTGHQQHHQHNPEYHSPALLPE